MSYSQEVYDAVRSKISGGDISQAVREVLLQQCDTSHLQAMIQENARVVEGQLTRPSVLFRPSLAADGTMWCALYGENLQEGVAGFGETPEAAMQDFDRNWHHERTPAAVRLASKLPEPA